MTLKQYDNYKPSGVEWLGEIPENWEILRVKDILNVFVPQRDKPQLGDNGFAWVTLEYLKGGVLNLNEVVFAVSKEEIIDKKIRLVPTFSVLASCVGEFSITAINLKPVVINQQIQAFTNFKKLNIYFFNYKIQSSVYKSYYNSIASETTLKYLNKDKFLLTPILFPLLSEQKEIAHYLDQKTTAIDRKINLLEKKIDRYQALRKSLINETVCRGLDKSVKLKESGIEWIGQVPEHWEVKRLKDLLRKNITDGPHETPEFINEGFPFISVDGIVDGELVFDDCRYISKEDFKRYSKKVKIEKDDLFIGKAASTGKIARVKVNFEFTVWSPIAVIKLSKNINPIFIEYFFKSEAVQHQIEDLCTHNTQKNIAMKDIPKIILAIPFIEEQIEIANYLEIQTQKIDTIISNIKKQIEVLKELRKTLINDVVTGKIRVNN